MKRLILLLALILSIGGGLLFTLRWLQRLQMCIRDSRYRGAGVFWKFDRQKGRIDREQSFAVEFPPYMQDLADAGKLASDGWAFFNSINTERATGGNLSLIHI